MQQISSVAIAQVKGILPNVNSVGFTASSYHYEIKFMMDCPTIVRRQGKRIITTFGQYGELVVGSSDACLSPSRGRLFEKHL